MSMKKHTWIAIAYLISTEESKKKFGSIHPFLTTSVKDADILYNNG